jgi:phosphoglycolate phosphatase-like HAD superfamily hydrolase
VSKKRVLLFDIDMTMTRTNGAGRAAMEAAFEGEFGIERATEGMLFDGRTDRGIFIECLERHGLANGTLEGNLSRLVEGYLEHLPASLKAKGGVVLPGVANLLAALSNTDAAIGLATGNLRRGAAHKLEHFGMWERFAGGGFGDDHIVRADLVRAGISEMAALCRCEPGDCDVIVLGDTPLDVEAAHLAGARALGVGTGRFTPEQLLDSGAEFALPDLSETERVLDMLLG